MAQTSQDQWAQPQLPKDKGCMIDKQIQHDQTDSRHHNSAGLGMHFKPSLRKIGSTQPERGEEQAQQTVKWDRKYLTRQSRGESCVRVTAEYNSGR